MNLKKPESVLKRPVATWLSEGDYDKFVAIVRDNNVTIATYLRAIITDIIAEGGK